MSLRTLLRTPQALRPALAVAALAALTACAPLQPDLVRVGRAQLELPPGQPWTPLAEDATVFDVLPDDVAHDLPMHSRLLGLRGRGGELLASVLVQTNATNYPRDTTLWTWSCPAQKGVQVEDATQGSPVRIDCLRYRRRADLDSYLEASRPQLAQMLAAHGAVPARPHSHVAYRYSTPEGGFIAIDVLADQRLLRPPTRNNMEFLRAGRPAQEWMHQLREAARVSAGMMDGRLVLPPFPQPLPQ
ncbi:hypothetical protein [Melaminivora alkalimesophila]|uniref:Lipoprotein n=1 Tax=Melaminivora alkalimesophila TaxID=1165852 RepID=A0A317RCI6_9BURK|nr:hypothetical protein [Melaminivora alkalimesophila]PWW46793.1 hypothetical protein DFR36_10368 [Melaminivora alkalimesophila]